MKSSLFAALVLTTTSPLVRADAVAPTAKAPAAAVPAADQKITLRLKLPVGQKYEERIVSEHRSAYVVNRQKFTSSQQATEDVILEVLAVSPEGNTTLRHTFGKFTLTPVTLSGPKGVDIPDANSAEPLLKAYNSVFTVLDGRSVETTVSPLGRVLSVNGVGELSEALGKMPAPAGNEDGESRDSLVHGLLASLNAKDKGMLQLALPLPEKAEGIGDTWTDGLESSERVLFRPEKVASILTARKAGVATIETNGNRGAPVKRTGSKAAGHPLASSFEGIGKRVSQVDEATGLTKHIDLTASTTTADVEPDTTIRRGKKIVKRPGKSQTMYVLIHSVMDIVPLAPPKTP